MNNLEDALRKALAKGDMHDAAFRRRIYEAAANALKRSYQTDDPAASDKLTAQTERLADAIRSIETEITEPASAPPVPPVADQAPPVDAAPDAVARVEPQAVQAEPPLTAGSSEDAPAVAAPTNEAPSAAAGQVAAGQVAAGQVYVEPRPEAVVRQKRAAQPARSASRSRFRFDRGPFASIFAGLVMAGLLFAGLWWVIVSGAFVSEEARDTAVPNPPLQLEEEAFVGRDPGTATAPERSIDGDSTEWTVLFTPGDPTVLRLEGGATASVETDPFGDYARLVAPGDARVYIDVPPGTLQSLAGDPVQISLRVRSDDGEPTQLWVTCDFGPLGECGRRRFNVDQSETEFLFHVDLPDRAGPTEPGFLVLRTDIADGEQAINLLAARIRPAEAQ